MSKLRNVHLFNCDRTYKLDAVEGLLNGMKAKLGFESVEKHTFSLSQMSEMSSITIPKLQMDLAFFVVHAHESRLSINEDNAGIGYAKIYRALLTATGGNVIIVIGGDDNYKNKDEEDQVVISRWARRKISSQFNEEFLDGRKSFIFSWNKKHREIHEEALLHYFDPNKKGQKFEYQPKPKPKQVEREAFGHRSTLQRTQSVTEQRQADTSPLHRAQSVSGQRTPYRNPLQKDQSVTEQRTADRGPFEKGQSVIEKRTTDSSFSASNSAERRTEGSRGGTSATMAPFDSEQGATKEVSSSSTGTELKDLAILGCSVSNNSMQAVRKVMQDIGPKLNLSENPQVVNLPPDEAKRYLARNKLKFCVLVVDAETIKDAYENLPQQKFEYEELLETVADKVDEKVIILICDSCSLSPKDETIVTETIERIVNQRKKGFTAWLKHGRLTADPDVLVQFLISTSPAPQPNPQTILSRDFQESTRVAQVSTADSQGGHARNSSKSEMSHRLENTETMQQPALQGAAPILSPTGEIVMLKSMLRYGEISCQLEDLQIWKPQFIVPDYIRTSLYEKHRGTLAAGVRIMLGVNGQQNWSVDTKLKELWWRKVLQIAANETLQLKTRLRYGLVSFREDDVYFRFGDWKIPQLIVDSLKQEYLATPCADLCIISDEKGQNFRCTVTIGKKDRILNFAKNWQIM